MKTYLLFLILLFSSRSYCQLPSANNYSSYTDKLVFYDFVSDGNCGHFILGYNTTINILFILHLNEIGDTLWTRTIDFAPYLPYPYGNIAKGDDGIYFITGKHFISPQTNVLYNMIGKLDFDGNLIWSKSGSGYFYNFNSLNVINNTLYLALPGVSSDTMKIYKLDSNGNEIWRNGYISQPGFLSPSIESMQLDSFGLLHLTGTMSNYSNGATLGCFIAKLDSNGNIISSSRIHSVSNTEFYLCEGGYNNLNGTLYIANRGFAGNTPKYSIRLQKINTISGTVFSKIIYLTDSLSILDGSFLVNSQNKILITGTVRKINNYDKAFQLALDTNLNILSAIQYSSTLDSLNIRMSKATYDCNNVTAIGNINRGDRSSGYLVKKENLTDFVCFQSDLIFNEYTVLDTIENLPISAYTTNGWTNVNAITGHLQLSKNVCSIIDGTISYENRNDYFVLYPNPAHNRIYIKGLTKNTQIEIYNSIGQLQCDFLKNDNNELDISNFAEGLYLYSITDFERNITTVGKLIKN
jgi:hypothetical protein